MDVRRTNCIAPPFDFSTDPVISIGSSMPDGSAAKNRYSFDGWRNHSCVREYREKELGG